MWFTDNWPELLDDGIEAVTLLRAEDSGEVEVYGPMSLHGQE
jgi:hypothetical protein